MYINLSSYIIIIKTALVLENTHKCMYCKHLSNYNNLPKRYITQRVGMCWDGQKN